MAGVVRSVRYLPKRPRPLSPPGACGNRLSSVPGDKSDFPLPRCLQPCRTALQIIIISDAGASRRSRAHGAWRNDRQTAKSWAKDSAEGRGLARLKQIYRPLDARNSGTTMPDAGRNSWPLNVHRDHDRRQIAVTPADARPRSGTLIALMGASMRSTVTRCLVTQHAPSRHRA